MYVGFTSIQNVEQKMSKLYTVQVWEAFKKKKSKISDIGKKGRVGWAPKTYFQKERNSDIKIGQGLKIH